MSCFRVNWSRELLTSCKTAHQLRSVLINWWSYPGQTSPATLRGRNRRSWFASAALSHSGYQVAAPPTALRHQLTHALSTRTTREPCLFETSLLSTPTTTRQVRGGSSRTPVLRWNGASILRNVAHRNFNSVCCEAHQQYSIYSVFTHIFTSFYWSVSNDCSRLARMLNKHRAFNGYKHRKRVGTNCHWTQLMQSRPRDWPLAVSQVITVRRYRDSESNTCGC